MKKIIIVTSALVLFGAGCAYQSIPKTATPATTPATTTAPFVPAQKPVADAGTTTAPAAAWSGTVLAGSTSPLIDFNKTDYDASLKTDKLIVLYFYANWCPECRIEVPHLKEAFNGLTTDRVIGFRVNYNDNETDQDEEGLARKFGVPYQHTKVFVKNGAQVLKSPESWDTARYQSEIKTALAR
jgi:thiol-disulfide isomerase/thioredoxin